VKAIYQKGETKALFLYWYQIKGKTLSNEYSLKTAEIINSILYRRRDSAVVRISVPIEVSEERALSTGGQFIRYFYRIIEAFLPA
jgi:EpsI family protein